MTFNLLYPFILKLTAVARAPRGGAFPVPAIGRIPDLTHTTITYTTLHGITLDFSDE